MLKLWISKMASLLGDTTCVIHPDRQSVARCPSCRQFFCEECITEHEGRLICANCLRGSVHEAAAAPPRKRAIQLMPLLQLGFALMIGWLLFYLVAGTLADIPDDFHDGTIWE